MSWFREDFDEGSIRWSLDTYAWLFENFGGYPRFKKQTLVTPTKDFLPFDGKHATHETAIAIFEIVKSYMGLEDWFCDLQDMSVERDEFQLFHGDSEYFKTKNFDADGLFEMDSMGRARIYYRTELLKEPLRLANVFAHELGHYMVASSVTTPPGGWQTEEYLADFTASFRGFGLFVVNQADPMRRHGDEENWGYASRSQLAYGLAIYCQLAGISIKEIKKYMIYDARGIFKDAMRDLEKNRQNQLETIRQTIPIVDRE